MAIDFICGKLVYFSDEAISIMIGGIAYSVIPSSLEFSKALSLYHAKEQTTNNGPLAGDDETEKNEPLKVYIYSHKKENEPFENWFGFGSRAERECFMMLLSVSGIGPKAASNIMNQIEVPDLLGLLINERVSELAKIKGLGVRKAEKMVVDLKKKAEKLRGAFSMPEERGEKAPEDEKFANQKKQAFFALKHLGYRDGEIKGALEKIESEMLSIQEGEESEDEKLSKAIKLALKELGR